ncbi:MAG: hypothetical protein K2G85_03295 [Muribaculaceae bacterium]|nr:hypothetical protein [Muribaculaceae bacterium]
MKPIKFIIYLLSIIVISSLPAGAVKTINVNPINLAVVIVEKTDSTKIQREFDYYGYTLHTIEDGFKVMKNPNGNEIRYCFDKISKSDYHSTVIVKPNESQSEIDAKLKDMHFKKRGDIYSRIASRDDRYIIQCTIGTSNTLLFKNIKR